MPTYEYSCEKCQRTIEVYQSMKDDAFTVCPKDKCAQKRWGKGKVKREIGAGAGLLFKGDGFYITDYRSEGYKKSAGADKPAPASDSKKKPDAKPAAGPAQKPAKKKT